MTHVLRFSHADCERDGSTILTDISWNVSPDQRWVIIGPNGAGKTTLLEIAGGWELPSRGEVSILGDDVRRTGAEWIRPRVGLASAAMAKRIPTNETVTDAVTSAAYAAAERRGEAFDDIDIRRARRVLGEWGLEPLASRTIGTLSEGEQKRVQIARAIMTDPELLLMDEPTAGLDLGAREELLLMLGAFAETKTSPAIVMVSHHIEEIPVGFTHAMVLSSGRNIASGPIADVITSEILSAAFGLAIQVSQAGGRYSARAQLQF